METQSILDAIGICDQRIEQNLRQTHKLTTAVVDVKLQLKKMCRKELEQPVVTASIAHQPSAMQRPVFLASELVCKEELDALENNLSLSENFQTMVRWITGEITATKEKQRIHDALGKMFSRPFFASCSWAGAVKKGYRPKLG